MHRSDELKSEVTSSSTTDESLVNQEVEKPAVAVEQSPIKKDKDEPSPAYVKLARECFLF